MVKKSFLVFSSLSLLLCPGASSLRPQVTRKAGWIAGGAELSSRAPWGNGLLLVIRHFKTHVFIGNAAEYGQVLLCGYSHSCALLP